MKKYFQLFIMSLFFVTALSAGFYNGGNFQSKHLNLNIGGVLENNGKLIGTESATISCDVIAGNGLVKSPVIVISTGSFQYKGVIECSGTCKIYSQEPFNSKMFTRKGGGTFEIFITGDQHKVVTEALQAESLANDEVTIDACLMH